MIINLIILALIAFGEHQSRIFSYITKKIIYSVISIEEIIIVIYYLAFSLMYLFCIIAYIAV